MPRPGLGVSIAIIADGQIVLIRREDFAVWALPAGEVEAGESLAQAAIREAREETGLTVELTRLVGVYSRPQWWGGGMHSVLFAARPVGGVFAPDPAEVTDIGYFAPDALPIPFSRIHHQLVRDALAGVGGSVARSSDLIWPFSPELSRDEIYTLRDQSGLPRDGFLQQYFDQQPEIHDVLEVGDEP